MQLFADFFAKKYVFFSKNAQTAFQIYHFSGTFGKKSRYFCADRFPNLSFFRYIWKKVSLFLH